MIFKNKIAETMEDKLTRLIEEGKEKILKNHEEMNKSAKNFMITSGVGTLGLIGAAKFGIAAVPLVAGATVGATVLGVTTAVSLGILGYAGFKSLVASYQSSKITERMEQLEKLQAQKQDNPELKERQKLKI
jgi:hypothetical protein